MLDSIRSRLTLWYVSVLAAVLVIVGVITYVLLARALYTGIDEGLVSLLEIASTSLRNDLAEGQDVEDAARSTAAELASPLQMLAIYDGRGALLAEGGRDDDLRLTPPDPGGVPSAEPLFSTVVEDEDDDDDDRHRLAVRRLTVGSPPTEYIAVAGSSLEPIDDELRELRGVLFYVVPLTLLVAALGGWILARQSLAPVMTMAERARRIGVSDLTARLPVANPRDELGRLAETFNELLGRLAASLHQQRQFMADASHELRTPVATARTAASVALQQPHRPEEEYRETLQIVEQQTARLSRVVEDMFILARADAGNYPVQRAPMYLDEVAGEAVRASRVLAAARGVSIAYECAAPSAALTGDEDLIRRLIGNVLDNAVRHAPAHTSVQVSLASRNGWYVLSVVDAGAGVPADAQPHIFERFYRGDAARRRIGPAGDGAGLGLALARWIARAHGGDVKLVQSSPGATTFAISLPADPR